MSSAMTVLQALRQAGFTLLAVTGKIRIKANHDMGAEITDDVRERIRGVRDDLLALLEAEAAELDRLAAELACDEPTDAAAETSVPPACAALCGDTSPEAMLASLAGLSHYELVARVIKTADRQSELIEAGQGDIPEAIDLQAERDWIGRHHPKAWAEAHFRPPIKRPASPPLRHLAACEVGELTPDEHWRSVREAVEHASVPSAVAYRLRGAASLWAARDGPTQEKLRAEYALFWRLFTTGER